MIYLVLAEPRTGKSQFVVSKMLEAKAAGKRVFVTNFNQTPEQREKSGFELYGDDGVHRDVWEGDVSKWFEELPHGSVWVVDECQDVFPQRGKDKPLPEWIKLLSKHGHHDLTIYFVTQDAMQLDVTCRRNTNFTLILSRPLARKRANVYTFRRYQEMPNDAWRRMQVLKSAESKAVFKYSKRYQDLYVSASAHDHIKPRLPWKLALLPVLLAVVVGCVWFGVSRLKGQSADEAAPDAVRGVAAALTGAQAPSAAASSREVLSVEAYAAQFKERIEGVPWSAPAYDGFEVKDYPRPVCYISGRFNECRCVTQQGSRLAMPEANCKMIVQNGYFDPYKDVPHAEDRDPDRVASEPVSGPSPVAVVIGSGGASSEALP